MSVLVTIAVVLVLALWGVAVYNRLVRLQNQVRNAWGQIDVQLKRRRDLIPSLVETVKGAMSFEQEALTAVVAARERAATARGPVDAAKKEGVLAESLDRFFAVVESYPQLTANQNVRDLQGQLQALEGEIAASRSRYNDIATSYNTSLEVLPNNVVAGLASFPKAELFQLTRAAERSVPPATLR